MPPNRNPAQVGESWLLQRGSRMWRRGKKPGKREKIRKTNYKIVNRMPAFPRSGEGRGAPSLGTFEGWGGVQARRSSQAGGKAPLPVPASFGIRQNDPCVGKRQRDTGMCPLRFSFHGKPRGERRNDRGRRQRLFPKQLRGLWQSLAVGSSSRGPARRFPR